MEAFISGAALIRWDCLFVAWPLLDGSVCGAALIRRQCLFVARPLLDRIAYLWRGQLLDGSVYLWRGLY